MIKRTLDTNPPEKSWQRIRREQQDFSVQRTGGEKMLRVDLGIAILQAIALPGVCYDQSEIAYFAGCTGAAILRIEQRALKKLRIALRVRKDPVLVELVAQFFDQRQAATPVQRL